MVKFVEASDPAFIAAVQVGAFKGAVRNLSNTVYHALDKYWQSSDLKCMHDSSPAHFKEKYFELKKEPGELGEMKLVRKPKESKRPTDDMILGSLVHCLHLTPDDFHKEFFTMPDLNLRTNDGKAHKEKLITENPNKLWITDEDLAQGHRMRTALESNVRAKELLEPGMKELALFWTCPFSHINFKAKLDQSSSKHFCELKTTGSAEMDEFAKHIDNMNYDLSLVHYRMGMKQVLDLEPPAFFIVVEREIPHVTQVYPVGDGFWQTGHEKWLGAVTKLERGIKQNEWPGYFPVGIEPEIQPPPWAMKKLKVEDANGI